MADAREQAGTSTALPIVSKEEQALSGQDFREHYANLVRKAEADLALEDVPIAYREYLRRYFVAIRPQDDNQDEGDPGEP
jgi:hypothetical protein